MVGLLALALLIRVAAIIMFPSIHHPDENFQLFEPAHRLAFGTGVEQWEFSLAGTRTLIPPFLYAGIFSLADTHIDDMDRYRDG